MQTNTPLLPEIPVLGSFPKSLPWPLAHGNARSYRRSWNPATCNAQLALGLAEKGTDHLRRNHIQFRADSGDQVKDESGLVLETEAATTPKAMKEGRQDATQPDRTGNRIHRRGPAVAWDGK